MSHSSTLALGGIGGGLVESCLQISKTSSNLAYPQRLVLGVVKIRHVWPIANRFPPVVLVALGIVCIFEVTATPVFGMDVAAWCVQIEVRAESIFAKLNICIVQELDRVAFEER